MRKHSEDLEEAYKQNMSQVSKAILQLDAFTNNLESKVDGILKAQQTEFVNSYKVHMFRIKQQFDHLSRELKIRDEKILAYENQGKMSNLIKRVNYLQAEEKKLLNDLQKRKADIRQLVLENSIKRSEIKRLEEKVKDLLKHKASIQERVQREASYESIPTFATQIGQQNSKEKLDKLLTQDKSVKYSSIHRNSQKSELSINPQVLEASRLQRQISQLRRQNRELMTFNSRFVSQASTMEKFFIQTVNQIKRNIAVRKQINECTLEQFRKQDKLELLIKILSNDELIFKLYSTLFEKKENPFIYEKVVERPSSLRRRSYLKKSAQYHFPSIKSARLS